MAAGVLEHLKYQVLLHVLQHRTGRQRSGNPFHALNLGKAIIDSREKPFQIALGLREIGVGVLDDLRQIERANFGFVQQAGGRRSYT